MNSEHLAHLQQVIADYGRDYGRDYARYSAEELWRLALGDRHHVTELLQMQMPLSQRRELYVTAAELSLVLAWTAGDRGQVRAALAYAADARYHATEAGHSEAVAWAFDVEATTWLYDDQPDHALRAAAQGVTVAPPGSAAQTRLTGQVARIHARLRHADQAVDALALLRVQAERHEEHAAGLFSADVARAWSVAATSHLWLGQDEQARDFATQASRLYERDRQASPTRWGITLLDLGTACARLGDLEEAVAHGLAAVSVPRYSAAIVTRSGSLGALLERRYPNAAVVERFRRRLVELQ
ncbi:hypothetical protein [Streptosporangium longisporum]|uniref:XRE family transcriptional regulator n=1 Tax=Streptosporangium longisporum TaxID=46187 RepID=A0ABP6L3V4_9ACTN